ncbi:hypothetical protein [Salmonella phage SD-1_S14]|nr:hypothetical protein [Salmonella phage SD-1_S14]
MNKEHKEFYIRKLTFVPVRIYKECDPRLYLWHFNECIKDSIYHKNIVLSTNTSTIILINREYYV